MMRALRAALAWTSAIDRVACRRASRGAGGGVSRRTREGAL